MVARLNLKLDKDVEPLPKDSIFRVRYRSTFGLKYLEIIRGEGRTAPEGFTFDGTRRRAAVARCRSTPTASPTRSRRAPGTAASRRRPSSTTSPTPSTRRPGRTCEPTSRASATPSPAAAPRSTTRSTSLEPLFRGLRPVTKVLIEPSTRFRRFFPELGDVARIVAPVAEQQADVFTEGGDHVRGDLSADAGALQETITETAPTLETGIDAAAAPAPVPDIAGPARDRAAPRGRATCGRRCRCSTTRSRSARPSSTTHRPRTTGSRASLRSLNAARLPADHRGRAAAARGHVRHREAAGQVRGPGADRLQLLELLVHVRAQRPLRPRPGRLLVPPVADPVPGSGDDPDAQPTATRPRSRTAERRPALGGTFKPYEVPILNAHPYGPTGQKDADCQGGQSGYELGQGLVPGQSPSNPAYAVPDLPGSRGPTTLFYNDDGQPRASRHADRFAPARDLEGDRPMRTQREGRRLPNWAIGLVLVIVIAVASVLAFTKEVPWGDKLRGPAPSSARPRTCGRARRCGSPASRSAR